MLVKKGSLTTNIREDRLQHYLNNGWVVVKETKEQPKDYDDYTVSQLRDIAKNRNIYCKSSMRKQEIIDLLINKDKEQSLRKKPTNEGFTDNLIKE